MKIVQYLLVAACSSVLAPVGGDLMAQHLPCRAISAGAETDALTGSIQNVGQAAIGIASNGVISFHAGAIPCLAPTPCMSMARADLDADCDVDLDDYAVFTSCASGPYGPVEIGCEGRDFDGDDDVDLADFSLLVRCFGGADHPPAATCSG